MLIHLTNTKGDVVAIDTTTHDFEVFLGAADPKSVDPIDPVNPEPEGPSPRTSAEILIEALIKQGFFKKAKTIQSIMKEIGIDDKKEVLEAIDFFLLNYSDDLSVRKVRGTNIYYDPVELSLTDNPDDYLSVSNE